MVSIASGSDIGGSIRIPASWTGLIGLKPTGQGAKFPLVKTIEDAKEYFDKTKISKPKTLVEVPKDLKTLKIAYTLKTPLKDVELSEDGKKAVLKAVEFLKKQGFTVEEVTEFPIDGYEGIRTYTKDSIGHLSYVATAKLATENSKRDLDPATYALGTSIAKGKNANTDTSSARAASEYINKMNEFYKKYDLFLMATNAVTAPSNDKKVDPYVDPEVEEKLYNINEIKNPKERFDLLVKQWEPMMRRTPFTWLFNLTGNPAISLPVYKSESNLPLGVMFAAKNNSEKILLEMGQLFQDNNQFILHPNVRNTVIAEDGNKVRENEYGTKYQYSTPSKAPITDDLTPYTGSIDGLSDNGNKVLVDKDGNVSEFNVPNEAPISDTIKPFTGKVDGLSENSNKINIDNQGNIIEYNTTKNTPTILELPQLNINNTTVIIKSNNNNISVELDNNYAKDLEFKAKDITKTIDLEDLKNKIVADKNNIIKNKDEITSVRVIDLELQKNNEEIKLNVPRTVHIALLQNEKNKDILVYHIKDDNTIELIPSNVTEDNLNFTVNHFSKFALITKIKTALASSEKDINSSAVQEEKKFTIIETRGAKSTPLNPPKTLPKTGATTNNFLTALGFSLLALTALLKRKNNN